MSSDESEPTTSHKRKSDVLEKTPKAILQEFCVQECEVLICENIPQENPKIFSNKAMAFEMCAIGFGRSKKEAEHDACKNLIGKWINYVCMNRSLSISQPFESIAAELVKLRQFSGKLSLIPPKPHAPHPTTDGDAVGTLLDICVEREWPLPTYVFVIWWFCKCKCVSYFLLSHFCDACRFDVRRAYGEPHRPTFTVICQLSSIKRTGTYSTKKGAKQIAARAVLDIIQNFSQNEEKQQIATVVQSEPPEKLFKTYRQLKDSGIKPTSANLRDRHLFFLRLPVDDRNEAYKILLDGSNIYGTNKDKVDLTCRALQLKYNIISVPNDTKGRKVFELIKCNHDCVLTGKEPDLYDDVISHFKTMLNLNGIC